MTRPTISQDEALEIDRVLRRFTAANMVSATVGLVLFPLFFGGAAIGAWVALPAWVGQPMAGIFAGCAVIGVLLMLWYRKRIQSRPAKALWVTVLRPVVTEGRHGQRAFSIEARIESASPFTHQGFGPDDPSEAGQTRNLRVLSEPLLQVIPTGASGLLLCVSTGEVVAARHGDQLVTA